MLEKFKALIDSGVECREFVVDAGGRRFTAMIASPPAERLDPDPVLLFTIGGQDTHFIPPNNQSSQYFLQHGHRVVSFPISFEVIADNALRIQSPGSVRKYNVAIEMLRDEYFRGPDPFAAFITEAKAVLRTCVEQKWVRPSRIVVTGISRFGYLALRLLAADDSLTIGGGFAPVTDWRYLSEFYEHCDLTKIEPLSIMHYVEKLTGKKICLVIGNHDERVNTRACCQFFVELCHENQKRGFDPVLVDFFCTPDPNHTCGDEWYQRGTKILLDWAIANI